MRIQRLRRVTPVALATGLLPMSAAAHGGPIQPGEVWTSWNLHPLLVLGIVAAGWFYGRGVRQLWSRHGRNRVVPSWRVATYYTGLLFLTVALVSPVDPLGETLFSAHMAQHLLLVLGAAPLLALGAPLTPWLWSLTPDQRRGVTARWRRSARVRNVWKWVSAPLTAWALHVVTLWVWHVPALYELAIESALVHWLEHAMFLGTALLFWWVALPAAGRRRLSHGLGVLYMFAATLQSGLLGALILFASSAWYPIYADGVAAWGLTPLEDQQLAGVIMWIPASGVYLVAALWLMASWLQLAEESATLAGDEGTMGTERTEALGTGGAPG